MAQNDRSWSLEDSAGRGRQGMAEINTLCLEKKMGTSEMLALIIR